MTYRRDGCPLSMERWSEEKDGSMGTDRVVLEDWIEFKNADGKTILKVAFSLWSHLGFELQGRLIEEMKNLYG